MLENKVAIVTGAAQKRGIGFAAARSLAGYGATVVLADLASDLPALEQRVSTLQDSGATAYAHELDITDPDRVARLASFARQTCGGVDILFNNAGITAGFGPFLEAPKEAWDQQFAVHVSGMADLCKAVIPGMQERGGGAIINNSSNWAVKAHAKAGIYTATKLGTIGLTKAIAAEFGGDNIRCNAIMPGPIRTDMQDRRVARDAEQFGITEDEARARIAAPLALKRVGTPKEIGDVVAFLASPMAAFITGAAIPVDGGDTEGL